MFYLNNFFKVIKDNLLSGILLSTISLILVIYMGNIDLFKNKVIGLYPEYLKGPYFYGLLSASENHSRIRRKMLELPGVNNVKIIEKNEVKNRALEILDNFNMGQEDEFNFEYLGMEVSLDREVNIRGQELIRGYLIRLAGEENITLGKIYPPSISKKLKENLDLFNRYGGIAMAGFLFVVWLFSFFALRKKIKKVAFLIEQYQRKRSVEIKIVLSGVAFFYLIGCVMSYPLPTTQWYVVAGVGAVFIVLMTMLSGRSSWEN
ncbi:MAG: hypothetical protein DRQ88_04900 [Epsilonproteobacteria bacterium]|nr:MAG: hypothetical protein DRQ89_08260 [Campylobacterota bacterium]RLA66873.1 MAG: hypothetical protein DRQ88_04900 [Campylobacterota bacterium]